MKLTQTRLREVLTYNPDTGDFIRINNYQSRFIGKPAGTVNGTGRMSIRIDGRHYLAHRLAWLYVTGEFPPTGKDIDHINRNPLDNRWCNLRLATRSQNLGNIAVTGANTTGYKNVYRRHCIKTKKCWLVSVAGTYHGTFTELEDAVRVANEQSTIVFGEYACTSSFKAP